MAGISKCRGEGCDKKQKCYRYTAPGSKWQSMIKPDPKDCKDYWPTNSTDITVKTD